MERLSIPVFLILLVTVPLLAEPPSQSYGPPSGNFNSNNFNRNQDAGGYQSFRNSFSSSGNVAAAGIRGNDPGDLGANIPGPKVFRHISLFVAPQDNESQQGVRTIRPQQGAPDKHYQIIFIKAPSRSSSQQTEVLLPPQPEQKTLVYVLVKKPEESVNNVKVRGPPPTKAPAPEVYFIKYRDGSAGTGGSSGGQNGGYSSNGGSSSGQNGGYSSNGGSSLPVRSSPSLSTSYGAP